MWLFPFIHWNLCRRVICYATVLIGTCIVLFQFEGLTEAFVFLDIVHPLTDLLISESEFERGYAAITLGYLAAIPLAKRQILNVYVLPLIQVTRFCTGQISVAMFFKLKRQTLFCLLVISASVQMGHGPNVLGFEAYRRSYFNLFQHFLLNA